jgi:DNA-directed RNA polymerase subunit RPC12/RpoP
MKAVITCTHCGSDGGKRQQFGDVALVICPSCSSDFYRLQHALDKGPGCRCAVCRQKRVAA